MVVRNVMILKMRSMMASGVNPGPFRGKTTVVVVAL
jgi:hypothetical protein